MKTRKQKGTGIFKNVLNFFSGRKTARRKAMKEAKLSNENEARKKTLEKKWFKTKKNKEELSTYKAKFSTPKEHVYEAKKNEALEARSRFQKFFNRFYKPQTVPTAKEQEKMTIEGLLGFPGNTRKPLNYSKLKIPDTAIPFAPHKPSEVFRTVNGERVELAGQATVVYMNAPLLYSLWVREPPKPTLELIDDSDFEKFVATLKRYDDDLDLLAKRVFHMPGGLRELEQWRLEHEEGPGFSDTTNPRYQVVDFEYIFPDGERIERTLVKIPASVTAGRLISDIEKGKQKLLEAAEIDLTTCPNTIDEGDIPQYRDKRTGRMMPAVYSPLTTLESNGCIHLLNSMDQFELQKQNESLYKNWIVIDSKYLAIKAIPVLAKYFKHLRVVQEAFDNWGIQGLDSALFELFQYKYPALSIKISTYFLSTKDFAYQQRKLKPFDNFFLLDRSIFSEEIALTAINPFTNKSKYLSMMENAIERKKLYGMSPYMAFFMKHNALPFWKRLFPSANSLENLRIYEGLEVHEQITVDYLQFLRFQEKLVGSSYDFQIARDSYEDFLGGGSLNEGLIKKLVDLYMSDYRKHSEELEQLQKFVYRPYINETFYNDWSKDFVQSVLMKFKRPVPIQLPPNNSNNNNNYSSPAVSMFPTPKEERTSFGPVVTRRTFAPTKPVNVRTMGAFERANYEMKRPKNERIKNLEAKLLEDSRILKQYEKQYYNLRQKYGNFEALKPKLNFLTRKLKYVQGTRKQLNQKNQQFLENYVKMRDYRQVNQRKQSHLKELASLKYPALPPSQSTMASTNTESSDD